MAKHHKHAESKKSKQNDKKHAQEEPEYPEKVEKTFKLILRILSWTVGVAFVLIVILPEFNKPVLDQITRYIYLVGIISLLVFIVIEFFAQNIKNLIGRLLHA